MPLGQRLVDQDSLGGPEPVLRSEVPAFQQPDLHHREVTGSRVAVLQHRPAAFLGDRLSLDVVVGPVAAGHGQLGDRRGADHAWEHREAAGQLVLQGERLRRVGILLLIERDREGQRVTRLEAEVHRLHPERGLDQQARRDEQHQGQGHLRHDQGRPQPPVLEAHGSAAATVLERLGQAAAGHLQGGRDSRDDSRGEDDDKPIDEDPGIEAQPLHAGHVGRDDAAQPTDAENGEPESERTTGNGEQERFGEQLAHQTSPRRTQRGAHRDLPVAGGRARQQEIGDVGTGDEEHEEHRHQANGPRLPRGAVHDLVEQGHGVRAHPQVTGRIKLRDLLGDAAELAVQLVEGRPRAQQPHHPQVMARAKRIGSDLEGRVEVAPLVAEAGRQDPDDGVGLPVEPDRTADRLRIGTEMDAPERIGEHHHFAAPGLLLFGLEKAALRGLNAEDGKEVRAHAGAAHPFRAPAVGHVVVAARVGGHGHRLALPPPIHEVGNRDAALLPAALLVVGPDLDHPVHVGVIHRPDQNEIHARENRHVDRDTERQGHGRDGKESRRLAQGPESVFDVLEQSVHSGSREQGSGDRGQGLPGTEDRYGRSRVRVSPRALIPCSPLPAPSSPCNAFPSEGISGCEA